MTLSETVTAGVVPGHDDRWVYFDGRFMPYSQARLNLLTHALHHGTGCFEGIRAYWSEEHQSLYALKLMEHYRRLSSSATVLCMRLPLESDELCEVTLELLRRNHYREDVYVRPVVFKSEETLNVWLEGLRDSFFICTVPFGDYVVTTGLRCMVSSWRRIDDNAIPARTKCTGAYINSALAKTEALQNGFDEAIVLTQDGHVCEGSAENIFLLRGGTAVTPPVTDDILEGVTRAAVVELLQDVLQVPVVERPVDRTELYIADEVFLCGTGAQVAPVTSIDRRTIGDGKVGKVTAALQSTYFQACRGALPRYAGWLTRV